MSEKEHFSAYFCLYLLCIFNLSFSFSPSPSPSLCSQALPYVALLIVMLFFIYAVIGMQVRPGFVCFTLPPHLPQGSDFMSVIAPVLVHVDAERCVSDSTDVW